MVECSGPASVVFDPSLTEYDFGATHPMSPIRVDPVSYTHLTLPTIYSV